MGRLMSVVHLLKRLIFGRLFLLGGSLDCRLLAVEALLVLTPVLGLCKNQNLGLRSRYTHSFSTIGGLSFLLLRMGY